MGKLRASLTIQARVAFIDNIQIWTGPERSHQCNFWYWAGFYRTFQTTIWLWKVFRKVPVYVNFGMTAVQVSRNQNKENSSLNRVSCGRIHLSPLKLIRSLAKRTQCTCWTLGNAWSVYFWRRWRWLSVNATRAWIVMLARNLPTMHPYIVIWYILGKIRISAYCCILYCISYMFIF